MRHRDAAARAPRRALDMVHLRLRARHLDSEFRRRRGLVANRKARDPARRAKVAFHERRRHRLHVRDVVEPRADCVGGKERVHVHVDVQQLLDRARILCPAQSLEHAMSGIRIERGGGVDSGLERSRKRHERAAIRATRARRRHHAGPKLPDHPLGNFGVLVGVCGIKGDKRQAAGTPLFTVAADAVLLDDVRCGRGSGLRCFGGLCHDGSAEPSDTNSHDRQTSHSRPSPRSEQRSEERSLEL